MVGETMAVLFPDGLLNQGKLYHILPGGYAVIGAAAMTGAMTHTVSTAVICFELTGEISHILPMMVAVILANMVAQGLQPSLYESIIQVKKLPYLPEFSWGHLSKFNISAGDIMVRNLSFVASTSTYGDILRVLKQSRLNTFPFVDTPESMILLGCIERSELRGLLLRQAQGTAGLHGGTAGGRGAEGAKTPSVVYIEQEDGGLQEREGPDVEKSRSTDETRPSTTTYNAKDPKQAGPQTTLWNIFSSLRRNAQEGNSAQEPSNLGGSLKLEEVIGWERRDVTVSFETCRIDPSPYQLVEKTSLQKTHTLFSLLGLDRAYVTSLGKLVGVVALREIQSAVEGTSQKGLRFRPPLASFRDTQETRTSGRLQTAQRASPGSRTGSPLSRSTALPDGATQTAV
ncbi:chloride channel protein-like isoform X2 [Mobula birostris]|uniref:chloride channel protein-like isoform X2 n=1 Tax=Mobula birostris TaxID=1983395 RepID=UPI003B2819CD